MKIRTKILLMLSIAMIMTVLFAISVSAVTPVETWDISATDTDSVTAYLYNDSENSGYYTLTVGGTGNMKNWSAKSAPWHTSYGSKIKSAVINSGVTNIGKCAFYSCTGLESITIPDSVNSIGNESFYNCTALTEINFDATSLANFEAGNNVFYNAGKNGNGITVRIGKNVTKIPERLLCPDSYDATYSPKVIDIVFEENSACTSIGRSAFNRCGSLTSINLPSSVTSIGMYAFLYCSSLKNITIPQSTTSIKNEAFNGCTALTEINFNATSMADLETGNKVFYNAGKNGNGITVTIGKNVTKIPARLLCPNSDTTTYAPKVTKVIFEENSQCTSIGQSAFNQCCYLTSINIPNTVTSIGPWAFQSNHALTSIIIPQGVTSINGSVFHNCTSLEKMTIPKSVTSIGGAAFNNCSSLKSITIPENVASIGGGAFYGCTALTEINFNATSMADLETGNKVFYNAGKNGNGITVTIGKNVTKIPARLLCPNSDTTTYAPKVTKVVFEENSVCTSIRQSAFNQCCYLTSINIPNTVTSIGTYAFQSNHALTSIIIPQGVTSISASVFHNCTSLESITIPKSVTSIGGAAFNNCSSLKSITIHENVASIGGGAFYGCTALTEINFNATSMADLETGNKVFYNAGKNGNGITVTIGKKVTKIPNRLFNPVADNTNVAPKIVTVIFVDGSVCTSIREGAFSHCNTLKNVKLPNTIEKIYKGAFYCTGIETIIIPNSVTTMGKCVFDYCGSLTIYAEAPSKPSGWDSTWNNSNCPVVWDYKNTIKNDVFTFKGYSFNESGSMAYGYDIDYEAKSLYEELTGQALEIGVVFAGYDNLGGNHPLDSKGQEAVLEAGKVIKASITSFEYSYYDFILYDVTDSIRDVKLVISAYIYDQETVKYVQENGLSNTVTGVSYNEAKGSVSQ